MSRHPAQDQLSAFLDGELDEAEAIAVEAALEAHPELREQLARLKAVQHLLRTHGRSRAPDGFAARVLEAAQRQAPAPAPWWRRPFGVPLEGVLVAAAAALVLVIAVPRAADVAEAPAEVAAGRADDGSPPGKVPANDDAAAAPGREDATPDGDDAVADAAGVDGLGLAGEGLGGGGASDGIGLGGLGTAGKGSGAAGYGAGLGSKGAAPEAGEAPAVDVAAPPPAPVAGAAEEAPATSPFAVSLYSEDEEVLGALQRLVAQHGGRLRDASGAVLKLGVLEQAETRVVAEVPGDQVTAFNRGLGALGARVEGTGAGELASDAWVQVPIRVVWVANAPSTPNDPAGAASRDRAYQADDLEASPPKQ